jgi:uncharacterized membrane protein
MPRNIYVVLFVLVLIAVIVSVDFLFFKKLFWERLMVNIGIVLVFAAFGLRFLKNPWAKRRGITWLPNYGGIHRLWWITAIITVSITATITSEPPTEELPPGDGH